MLQTATFYLAYDTPIENMIKKCSRGRPQKAYIKGKVLQEEGEAEESKEHGQREHEEAFIMKSMLESRFSIKKALLFFTKKNGLSIGKWYYP